MQMRDNKHKLKGTIRYKAEAGRLVKDVFLSLKDDSKIVI